MKHRFCVPVAACGLLAGLTGSLLNAQTTPSRLRVARPSTSAGSPATTTAASPAPATADKAVAGSVDPASPQAVTEAAPAASTPATTESPRLAALKKLTYDRRPSAILRAWANLDKESTAGTAESQPAAAVDGGSSEVVEAPATEGAAQPSAAPSTQPADPAAAAAAAEQAAAQQALQQELKTLQRNVTLGRWTDVEAYLASLPADEAKAGYAQMVKSLGTPPKPEGGGDQARATIPGVGPIAEQNVFSLDDVIALAAACPHELDRASVTPLAPCLRLAIQAGLLTPSLIARLEAESQRPAEELVLGRPQCAWLLVAGGLGEEVERFLPPFDDAVAAKDAESLILLAQCLLARHSRDAKPELLDRAWTTLQPALTLEEAKPEQRDEALTMSIALAPRIRDELGQTWLEESFAREPERGMRILAATGTSSASGLLRMGGSPDQRLANLRLQKTAVESLLASAPDRATEWQPTLRLLAAGWLREAETSRALDRSTYAGPRVQRDMYGNMFFMQDEMEMQMNMPRQSGGAVQPIAVASILEVAPGDAWLAHIEEPLRPKHDAVRGQLHLKVSQEELAWPYIERIAGTHPDLARDLVQEFVRVWTRNNDPNASRRYTSSYMYIYGFEMRAAGIPLTRSKQERNLRELARWVERIRALPIKDVDESLLARAFTTCHSSAEVYRVEAIEGVFGRIGDLAPKTLAELVQQMRGNLAGVWRMPAQQEAAKTQRKQKDIETEVLRGYEVARQVVADGLKKHSGDWRLQLAEACLLLDENTYRNELAPSSEFSERRLSAVDRFQQAADLYAKDVSTLPEAEQTTLAFEHWFYAGLGASDVAQLDHRTTPDPRQPARIRAALLALPGETAEKHMGLFANSLFTRMSGLKPNMKFPYLDAGFEIVDDAEQAREARKVYDYYKDLVTEIQLVTRVDGSAKVGHDSAFGVFIDLHHTREIERESGGFAKYLMNQNSMSYAYNYGRPLENYREKFEEAVRIALEEHFDVLSVTFQEKDVHSRASTTYGWRDTPYAYVLLKAKGPEVDKLPSLKMDLDFLDTSGYVVLPITSPPLPLDASPAQPDRRPYDKLQLTQTLDERRSAEGKLVLEIKATARGLVPALEELVDVRTSDFEVTDTEDEGVAIAKFDPERGEPTVISERTWMVTYAGRKDLAALPTTFHFPEPTADATEVTYLRYDDADLKSVDPVVSLEQQYGEVRRIWPWAVAAGVLILLAAVLGWRAWRRRRVETGEGGLHLPQTLTPFNVLSLLRRIEENNGFDPRTRQELASSIETLERYYFAGSNGSDPPDLRRLAETWVGHAR